MPILKLVIQGRCYTKKNTQIIITAKNGKHYLIPKKKYREYEKTSILQLQSQTPELFETIKVPVHIQAHFYMPNKQGWPDLLGVEESIGDILEKAKIIENDRNIISWDGSRLMGLDKENARVEITLEEDDG